MRILPLGILRPVLGALFSGVVALSFIPAARAQFYTSTALPAGNLSTSESFGSSVAISADGNTAIVGAPGDGGNSNGAAFVFVQANGSWTLQQKLFVSDAGARQGCAVSISSDGNTALVGGYADNGNKGAAWIWVRDNGVWTEQQKLVGDPNLTGQNYAAFQGAAVALSGDGETAFLGGYEDNQETGAVWVFIVAETVWTQQAKLVAPALQPGTDLGQSVATSYDGDTLIAGAPGYGSTTVNSTGTGVAFVWTRDSDVWEGDPVELLAPDASPTAQQGKSVALSADGTIAVVGAIGDNSGKGSAIVWKDTNGQWAEYDLLEASAATGTAFGYSVAVTANGLLALVGEPNDHSVRGTAWVFPVMGNDEAPSQTLAGQPSSGTGFSVALSSFGTEALLGAPLITSSRGEAAAFSAASVPLTILTYPVGLPFSVDGVGFPSAPATVYVSAGQHTISVSSLIVPDSGTHDIFYSWSDGGTATHTVTVAGAGAAYTATFRTQYRLTIAGSPSNYVAVTPTSGFYDSGLVVTLSATGATSPGTQYVFVGWSDGGAQSHAVTVTAPATYTATFQVQFQLTLQASPAAAGTVTPASGQFYSPGTAVTITATALPAPVGAQNVFLAWSDGGAASHSIIVAAPATYSALFKTQYQLTTAASPPQGGTVTPASGGFYDYGTMVGITATANNGYSFGSWSLNVANPGSQSTSVTMTSAQSVTATFTSSPNLIGIAVQTNPAGLQFSIDGGALQTAPQTPQLTAGVHTIAVAPTQAGGMGTQYVFTGWSDGGAASHSITVTSPGTYTASFNTQYQLTIAASPAAGGTVTPASGAFYNSGASVPVAATAAAGFSFSNWTGGVASAASASTTVTMSAPETVVANFSSLTGITIQTSPPGLQFTVDGGATMTAPQTLNLSQGSHTILLSATQAGTTGTQYVFTSWSDSNTTNPRTITVGSSAATFTAAFQTQYQLTISASPAAGGTVSPASGGFYSAGTSVPISATAAAGFTFSNWTGSVASGSSASTTVTMSAPETIMANFSSVTGITIQTSPPGLQFTIDSGPAQTAPQTLNLSQGSHTIAVAPTQAGTSGTQYVFTAWNDNGAASHSITAGSSAATFTAAFQTQYQLTISASPAAGGTVSPASGGFYNAGASVPISATAAAGFTFSNWTGSVAAATSASTTVTMSAPETVVANFTIVVTTNGLGFFPVAPCRVMDTRSGQGKTDAFGPPTLAAGSTRSLSIPSSTCNIPSTALAYSLNVTVVPQVGLTYLTIWPAGQPQPVVSTLNSINGAIVANAAIVPAGGSASGPGGVSVFASDATDVIIDINGYFGTLTPSALAFYSATPCRIVDTRNANGPFGGPMLSAGLMRSFTVPASTCNIPSNAQAYSLNVTVVPPAGLLYLSIWPAGQTQPVVSTLNSLDGRIAANAAIVPAGTGASAGAIDVFVSDASHVIIDINGYFAPGGGAGALYFYPATPCRIADTRTGSGFTGGFGAPALAANATRNFGIPSSGCEIPSAAQAYSLNMTAVPPGSLLYLSTWPAGQTQPMVSTLNDVGGQIVANAAIVPAGVAPNAGAIAVFVSDPTNLIIDINGYFGQ